MLVEGKWTTGFVPARDDQGGRFVRRPSTFRNWITPDGRAGPSGEDGFPAEAGRYHLYISLNCPWACRTLMVRKLKGLEDAISFNLVEPATTPQGWQFSDRLCDELYGSAYLHEIYTKADPHFTGRVTVPVLWDKKRQTIVNNESSEIIRMLNGAFGSLAKSSLDLYPKSLAAEIDAINEVVYPKLNNGVYRCGFAMSQAAYEDAFADVFSMLDELEERLTERKYLVGERLTEADIRLFVTLIRFDAAYHGLFKCNLRRIADYPNLAAYTKRILEIPGIAETVSIDHIKRGYYSLRPVNPSGIVPVGPDLSYLGFAPDGRTANAASRR
jgi:glutathionyl-hydroquinone reductase